MMRGVTLILTSGLIVAGCEGSQPGTQAVRSVDLEFIFARSCAFSACHGEARTTTGNLKLSGTDALCNLTGPSSGLTFRAEARTDFPRRVVPGDRQHSFLYQKLTLSDAQMGATQPLGERMPRGGMLDSAEVELFGRWIDDGAQDDRGTGGSCQ